MIEHHNNITRVNFIITSTTLYVLVLTCYINFSEQIQIGNYNTTQTPHIGLSDWSELRKINRLFVLSFKNGDDDLTRNSFDAIVLHAVNRNQIF